MIDPGLTDHKNNHNRDHEKKILCFLPIAFW